MDLKVSITLDRLFSMLIVFNQSCQCKRLSFGTVDEIWNTLSSTSGISADLQELNKFSNASTSLIKNISQETMVRYSLTFCYLNKIVLAKLIPTEHGK